MARNVLMIAFHYPPVRGSSGIQRTLKFSSYLRDHGWEPTVLSISPRAFDQVGEDQMGEIPAGMRVERPFGLNTARHLAIGGRYANWMAQPDRWVSWWPAAVWRGLQVIRQTRPEVIFSTYPIATAHLIGLTLQRLSGLPWVADCRDSLSEPGYPSDPLTFKTNRRLEQAMVKRCARAVFTTNGTLDMYATRYPEVPRSRWAVIENGYDEENFRDAGASGERAALGPPGRVTLLHSGILYPQERDPRPFFAALRALKAAGEVNAASLCVLLRATGSDDIYRTMLAEYQIEDLVELAPPVGYKQALQEMLRADGLLLFQATMCNHQIPAKLYEYLRSGRPVFTLTDPIGNTAESMRGAGQQAIVNIADEASIQTGLRQFLQQLRSGAARGASPEVAAAHSRHARTRELAALLDTVARENREKR
jgi:glycosyltransferase involved in cell wall biosynthesis